MRVAPGRLARFAAGALLALFALPCLAQRVALSFDDGLDPSRDPQAAATNEQLLAALRAEGLQAGVFPSLVRIGGEAGLPLLRPWGEQGHLVGNHTASHRSLASRTVTLEGFIADVAQADEVLGRLPGFQRRLRFPFLKEGADAAKRDGMRAWMARNGYGRAPVSIDTSDWYYAQVDTLLHEQGRESERQALLDAYLAHLLDRARFYDGLARSVLGRSPEHVMLLHLSALNARALPELVRRFRSAGWTFVGIDAAFQDPLYAMTPDVLPAGESIVWSLARAAGLPGLRYPAEDAVHEQDRLRAAGLPTP